MSEKVLCEKSDLVAIADAVREATGSTENYNVSELSAATVEAISAGGSGGNVETCTIRLICNTSDIYGYTYLAYRDGNFVPVFAGNGALRLPLDVTLPDVICNGYIYVSTSISKSFLDFSVDGEVTVEVPENYMYSSASPDVLVCAPNAAGSVSTVTIIDND